MVYLNYRNNILNKKTYIQRNVSRKNNFSKSFNILKMSKSGKNNSNFCTFPTIDLTADEIDFTGMKSFTALYLFKLFNKNKPFLTERFNRKRTLQKDFKRKL